MSLCNFKYWTWGCPLDSEDKGDFCYWHKIIDKKEPVPNRLTELQNKEINFTFLKEANLYAADLKGAYILGANLKGANLSGANLEEANLREADLEGANIFASNLKGANLFKANLQRAYLVGADFKKANLLGANLKGANLGYAKLEEANLIGVYLQEAKLVLAKLLRTNLEFAELQGTCLESANMQGANLRSAKLQGADLRSANLKGVYLELANMQGANMKLTAFDSASNLDNTLLKDANLHLSYIDIAKSFRNALLFEKEKLTEKEINEKIADSIVNNSYQFQYKFDMLFDMSKIDEFVYQNCDFVGKYLLDELKTENKVKPAIWLVRTDSSNYILYSDILDFITDISHSPNSKRIKNKIDSILFQEELEQSCFFYNPIVKNYTGFVRVSSKNQFLYCNVNKVKLYEASKEVYTKLHHFYLNEGMAFREKHAHYRRAEVDRKLLLVKHKWKSIEGLRDRAQWFFNRFVLKMLTNYGESILRPILISILGIIAFGIIYMVLEGVKVSGRAVNLVDYFYLSMTTFTSLGFADVQPDITVKWMQPLIMAESTMGVAMVALIIFVITYQISR